MNSRHVRNLIALLGLMAFAAVVLGISLSAEAKSDDKAQIKALEEQLAAAIGAKDVGKIMQFYAPGNDLFVFDVVSPRQYVGAPAYRKDFEDFFATAAAGPTTDEVQDLDVTTDSRIAFAHYTSRISTTDNKGAKVEMVIRTTDCLQKIKGKWLIVHEHNSVPVDLANGAKPDLMSKP